MPGHTPPRFAPESLSSTAEDRRSVLPIGVPPDREWASGLAVCHRQGGPGRSGGALALPETGA